MSSHRTSLEDHYRVHQALFLPTLRADWLAGKSLVALRPAVDVGQNIITTPGT